MRFELPAADLAVLAREFGLGSVRDVRYLPDGLMNRNWRLGTERGVFALKQLRDCSAETARRNLGVLAALVADGVPAPGPLAAAGGDTVVEPGGTGGTGGNAYCVLPWSVGRHLRGTELSAGQAARLGVELGRIHLGLNRLGPGAGLPDPVTVPVEVVGPAEALAEADRFLAAISRLPARTVFDRAVARTLADRKGLLTRYAADRPANDRPCGPFGWTHGDLQPLNVLWYRGAVAAVLDWDRIRVQPLGAEVARTAVLHFADEHGRLDTGRVAAFTTGYRTVVPLTRDGLADAVHRLWWRRMSGYWQLVFHYDRADPCGDHLFGPGERLLGWWTSHREEVQAAFAAGAEGVRAGR